MSQPTSKKTVLEQLVQKTRTTTQDQKKRKRLAYAFGALLLLAVAGYFIRQFNLLYQSNANSIAPPSRVERLDSTKGKETTITRLYELEEKNRHRDSITRLEEDTALDYIVMDWENLYDVRKKESSQAPDGEALPEDTSRASLQSLLRDSVQQEDAPHKRYLARRSQGNNTGQTFSASRRVTRSGNRAAYRNTIQGNTRVTAGLIRRHKEEETLSDEKSPVDPFNTGRALDSKASVSAQGNQKTKEKRAAAAPDHTRRAGTTDHTDGPRIPKVVPAVVHGDCKVQNGSKVTFRTREEAVLAGIHLPVNTLITGLAQLSNGRITFSDFRVKLDGSNVALPFTCYDSDMMAGISYSDQGILETEVRRGSTGALADAGSALSNAIPHSALARASGNIARGVLRGAARKRESFIYLSDGYKVFLEFGLPK